MNIQSEDRFASYPGIRSPRLPKRGPARIHLAIAALVVGLLASLAGAATAGETVCARAETPHAEPGALFGTLEEAAIDALAHADQTARPRDHGRLRLGTIYRVGDAFSYSAPMRSEGTVWSSRPPILRFVLRPVDVASYMLHPRSGSSLIDRANEVPNASERRVVDELDPHGRPLYVMTPSRRVLRYVDHVTTEVALQPESALLVAGQ